MPNRVSGKHGKEPPAKPISLAALSFEEAVKALATTPPVKQKPKREQKTRTSKRPNRKKFS